MGLRKRIGQKSYWHLLNGQRRPLDYEIASRRLHYYPTLGFSVGTPINDWYRKYQKETALGNIDLEEFSDPRRTTYTSYTKLQSDREIFISGLLDSAPTGDDRLVERDWAEILAAVVAPLRYPCHALMMLAAYLSSMAPESRVTIAAAFQSADEIRRVHGLARRLYQLNSVYPEMGKDAKTRWLQHQAWQPLRKLIETTLVAYDWSECFVKLNLVLKPSFDYLFDHELASAARASGDTVTAQLFASFEQDSLWHRAWTQAFFAVAWRKAPACRGDIMGWLHRYIPETDAALSSLARAFTCDPDDEMAGEDRISGIMSRVSRNRTDYLQDCGFVIQ